MATTAPASSRSELPRPDTTLVLACANEDALAMPTVLKRLVSRGVRVELAVDVDLDERPFRDAVASATSRTVFVLCRSDDLDAFAIDRLRSITDDGRIANDRVFVLPFQRELPIDFAETLLRRVSDAGLLVVAPKGELPPVPTVESVVRGRSLVSVVPALEPTATDAAPAPLSPTRLIASPVIASLRAVSSPPPRAVATPVPTKAPVVRAPAILPPQIDSSQRAVVSTTMADDSFFALVTAEVPVSAPTLPPDFDDEITAIRVPPSSMTAVAEPARQPVVARKAATQSMLPRPAIARKPATESTLPRPAIARKAATESMLPRPAIARKPATEPTLPSPPIARKTAEPVIAAPAIAEPVIAEPVIAEPVIAEPVIAQPVVAPPTVAAEPVAQVRPLARLKLVSRAKPMTLVEMDEPVRRMEPVVSFPPPRIHALPETSERREPTGSLPICEAMADADLERSASRFSRRMRVAVACVAALAAITLASLLGDDSSAPSVAAATPRLGAVASGFAEVARRGDASDAAAATTQYSTAVMAALEARQIRALDGLLVSPPSPTAMRRATASKRCRNLVVGGLGRWRLPTSDELAALGDAHFLGVDTIWWRAGRKLRQPRVEWNGTRARPLGAKRNSDARTLCVRGQ